MARTLILRGIILIAPSISGCSGSCIQWRRWKQSRSHLHCQRDRFSNIALGDGRWHGTIYCHRKGFQWQRGKQCQFYVVKQQDRDSDDQQHRADYRGRSGNNQYRGDGSWHHERTCHPNRYGSDTDAKIQRLDPSLGC